MLGKVGVPSHRPLCVRGSGNASKSIDFSASVHSRAPIRIDAFSLLFVPDTVQDAAGQATSHNEQTSLAACWRANGPKD